MSFNLFPRLDHRLHKGFAIGKKIMVCGFIFVAEVAHQSQRVKPAADRRGMSCMVMG